MDEKKKKIEELTEQLTPRGAFEAIYFGTRCFANDLPEGARFLGAYKQIRALEGHKIILEFDTVPKSFEEMKS